MRSSLIIAALSLAAMGIFAFPFGGPILAGAGVILLIVSPILLIAGIFLKETGEPFPVEAQMGTQAQSRAAVAGEPLEELPAVQRKYRVKVDWDKCMGAGSCVIVAPDVFQLDETAHKSLFMDRAPLRVKDGKRSTDENILIAAQSCPYYAIIVEDENGEQIYP